MTQFLKLALMTFLLGCTHSRHTELRAPSSSDRLDYQSYAAQFEQPQLYQDNVLALNARIKLLDSLPPGGTAKIMTFVYDNGTATRLLAVSMCRAAMRGVRVQFTADSKTGDRPMVPDAFDEPMAHKVNEEVYQLLANCGVDVTIHNHISEFERTYTGKAIPAIPRAFGSAQQNSKWSGLAVLERLVSGYGLKGEISEVIDQTIKGLNLDAEAFARAEKLKVKTSEVLNELFRTLLLAAKKEDVLQKMLPRLEQIRTDFAKENLFTHLNPEKLRQFNYDLIQNIQKHQKLGVLYRNIRVFNRLNHRKLFYASYDNTECMFIGGRNLGNHYLAWTKGGDEFMDADVFTCNHQNSVAHSQIFKQAVASFDAIFYNTDKLDVLSVTPQITKITKNPNFQFIFLVVPDEVKQALFGQNADTVNDRVAREIDRHRTDPPELPMDERTLPMPMTFNDSRPIQGIEIHEGRNWRVQTSRWGRNEDKVRQELVGAIQREKQKIYLETAYSEFNSELRNSIQAALERGVKVHLVTNSIYVSDAGSKLIRLVMARWTREMLQKYKGNDQFKVQFATLRHGHMIHFKGASFACQKQSDSSEPYRLNLIGSHNFHGRSGFSDKEHALIWEQPTRSECDSRQGSTSADLSDLRHDYYSRMDKTTLSEYKTFQEEIADALATGKLTESRRKISDFALRLLYQGKMQNGVFQPEVDENGLGKLHLHDEFLKFLDLLYDVGFSDLVGTLL